MPHRNAIPVMWRRIILHPVRSRRIAIRETALACGSLSWARTRFFGLAEGAVSRGTADGCSAGAFALTVTLIGLE